MPCLVKLGAIAGLSSVMVVMMMAQPRIFYSMAQRRAAAGMGADDPSPVPDAAHHDDRHRDRRRHRRRAHADWRRSASS